jgi:hypothetical protein
MDYENSYISICMVKLDYDESKNLLEEAKAKGTNLPFGCF